MVAVTRGWVRTTGLTAVLLLSLALGTATMVEGQESTPGATQPVVMADTEITWTGAWEYDTEDSYDVTSIPEQAIFFQRDEDIDEEVGFVKLLTYGLLGDESAATGPEAVRLFAELFLDGMSPNALTETARGEGGNGTAWALFTFTPSPIDEVQDQSFSSLISAQQDDTGATVITSLTAPTDLFGETIQDVQNAFVLDGNSRFFDDIDVAQIVAELPEGTSPGQDLAATPAASPEATFITSPEATPDGSSGALPSASPDATPLSGAEATLAAVQGMGQVGTPAASPSGAPESTPEN